MEKNILNADNVALIQKAVDTRKVYVGLTLIWIAAALLILPLFLPDNRFHGAFALLSGVMAMAGVDLLINSSKEPKGETTVYFDNREYHS